MRLLHVRELRFEEFFDQDLPDYAILSHRWSSQEVSYKQYVDGSFQDGAGIRKIREACAMTLKQDLEWLWVDTICIDKSSSAELTEAINSMWKWYLSAAVCFAFLADVTYDEDQEVFDMMAGSEWFLRGWTLQELMAPKEVLFFDRKWQFICRKNDWASVQTLARITGIGTEYLLGSRALSEASVAMRMSWAADRVTTRPEDQAYCLLGLFRVNMPLLYGEGHNAFFRLQLEIMNASDDESIFAWRSDVELSGLLADSPRCFKGSRNVHKLALGPEQRLPWAWTNKGLELRIIDRAEKSHFDPMPPGNPEQVVYLGCYIKGGSSHTADIKSPALQVRGTDAPDHFIAIEIKRLDNAWYRTRCDGFYLDFGFQTMSRFMKTPLVYKIYYVPRCPSWEAYEVWKTLEEAGSSTSARETYFRSSLA